MKKRSILYSEVVEMLCESMVYTGRLYSPNVTVYLSVSS